MNSKNKPMYDIVGIGNAIVDILSFCGDDFLENNKLAKGSMQLVDEERSAQLYRQEPSQRNKECSGGSVANTLAGMAALGARAGFIGKVANDTLGDMFTIDMQSLGVTFKTQPTLEEITTASCLVFVTPDAQRTMATYIGACSLVSEADIDETMIRDAKVLYVEGYLWDTEHAKAAIRKAMKVAHAAGRMVAFTLSDTFCVDRHRGEFLELINNHIDIVFANEQEIMSLYQTNDLEQAIEKLDGVCKVAVITRSEKGCIVLSEGNRVEEAAAKVDQVVDTTGAGDLFASGFLYGVVNGYALKDSAKLGNRCAGLIIRQLGARCDAALDELVA
ncbi:MAG: adenosine kinase [Alphaproteobacteria bacterium]